MRETPLNMVASVVATCVVASSALAGTYLLTRDRILEQEQVAEARSLAAAHQGADEFEPVTEEPVLEAAQEAAGDPTVLSLFEATTEEGEPVGWALKMAPRGYGGPIQMVVAVDRNGKVVGASILTMNETPGLGTQVDSPAFLSQFIGWSATSVEEDVDTLDAISGATRSSRGVMNGVVGAVRVYEEVLSEGEGEAADE